MHWKAVPPLQRLVFTGLFAALICVCTLVVQVPSPINGYINLGDGMILLAAFMLGPWWGFQPALLGATLADVIGGYIAFAPGTAVDKSLTAIAAGLLFILIRGQSRKPGRTLCACVVAGVAGELVMAAGYLVYEGLIMGIGWAALGEVPGNLVQGGVAVVLSTVLYLALSRVGALQNLFSAPDDRERKE